MRRTLILESIRRISRYSTMIPPAASCPSGKLTVGACDWEHRIPFNIGIQSWRRCRRTLNRGILRSRSAHRFALIDLYFSSSPPRSRRSPAPADGTQRICLPLQGSYHGGQAPAPITEKHQRGQVNAAFFTGMDSRTGRIDGLFLHLSLGSEATLARACFVCKIPQDSRGQASRIRDMRNLPR